MKSKLLKGKVKLHKKIPAETLKVIKEIKDRLICDKNIKNVILFGSYSKGTFHKDSDIDIAVFVDDSVDCLKCNFRDAVKICSSYTLDIQVQTFYESELTNPIGIVEEVLAYGTEITNL